MILASGSGRALEGNQKRGALFALLATNRPSEIVQISSERVDLRVANRLTSAAFFLRLLASGVRRCRGRDVVPIAARQNEA